MLCVSGTAELHRKFLLVVVVYLLSFLVGGGWSVALDVPYLSGRVNDRANMLDEGARAGIDSELIKIEQELGPQMILLTVPTLENDSLEDFSLRVVEAWKPGRAGQDDGVLLLVVGKLRDCGGSNKKQ